MIYKILFLTLVIGLTGCGKSGYYVLSTASHPEKTYNKPNLSIGLQNVELPEYLDKRKLTYATSESRIMQLDNVFWAEDLDVGLKHRLISFLQKKFKKPEVFLFPWGSDSIPDVKINVHINRFLAQNGKVYLDGSWVLIYKEEKKSQAHMFVKSLPIVSDEPTVIVEGMHKVFTQFEEAVADSLMQSQK